VWSIGGITDNSSPELATVEAFTPGSPGYWSSVAPLNRARTALAATVGPDGRIYAIGGSVGTDAMAYVEVYGPIISLSSASGAAGSTLTVSGSNFAKSCAVDVSIGTQPNIASGNTDGVGSLTANIQLSVPSLAAGTYQVIAVDRCSRFPVHQPFTIH
jgi:hypothetical protein